MLCVRAVARKATTMKDDSPDRDLSVTTVRDHAAGIPAVAVALRQALRQMGPMRTARTLTRVNQHGGFDCMSCAWPDPDHRHAAEFCENGAKAVAEEATKARDLMADAALEALRASSRLAEEQGRDLSGGEKADRETPARQRGFGKRGFGKDAERGERDDERERILKPPGRDFTP